MEHDTLWAPWRMQYIRQLEPDAKTLGPATIPASDAAPTCFLCDAAAVDASPPPDASPQARQRLLLLRDERGMILLNRYPYTTGHLLIACRDHRADLNDLTLAQRSGLMELTALAQRIVERTYNPQGFNVGINLGRCAGAGLPGHLHIHLVPRWNGDTNFMSIVGKVRVIPEALDESYAQLRRSLADLTTNA